MVYIPQEDSFLLQEQVKEYILKQKAKRAIGGIKVLDMGSGSGIQAQTCIKAGVKKENVLCADIDKETIYHLKKEKLRVIKSNLFSKIKKNKENKFNLIIFNAPYLPEDKYDKQVDTTAGKKGNEIIISFLKQAKNYLKKEGSILLLFSNLSKPKTILTCSKKLDYKSKKLAEQSMGFFEKIFVYEFYHNYL